MDQTRSPKVFILNPALLLEVKKRIHNQDEKVLGAWQKLKSQAADALNAGPFSVVHKALTPPSGDKRDYMSIAPYWWPNPHTADGLPYIRRDGEVNPERTKLDRSAIGNMSSHADTLALAYFYSGEEAFAEKAAQLLRTWFMDEETRMNPHLNYGQGIRGICDGRGIGIIETRELLKVVNAIGLLEGSAAWTAEDQSTLIAWFTQYLDWLLQSDHGQDEAGQANNHGTHYDVQVAVFSLFTGEKDIAKRVITESAILRVASQIEPDGRQPLELARTKALGYSTMNLDGWLDLAAIAASFGIDLYNYKTADGRGIRAALDYIAPFYTEPEAFPYPQIQPMDMNTVMKLLRRGALAYDEQEYERIIDRLPSINTAQSRIQLLYPAFG